MNNVEDTMKKIVKIIEILYKKFAIYLYYTAKPHYVNPIHILRKFNEISAKEELQKNKELWNHLTVVINRSQSTGCEFSDYLMLYKTIISLNPKHILELGSGVTTSVIAYAIKEQFEHTGEKAIFISMEENPFYYNQIKDIFPDDLKPYVIFCRSNRKEKMYKGFLGCYYESIPDYPYDFVFIDGPTLRATPSSSKCFNSDFINIIMKSNNPVTGMLDQRIGTYWALKKLLPRAAVNYYPIKKITYIRNANKQNLINLLALSQS